MRTCTYCGESKECRPYGPRGEMICFHCAFSTPEREAQTKAAFTAQLDAAGPHAVIGDEVGPYPLEHAALASTQDQDDD